MHIIIDLLGDDDIIQTTNKNVEQIEVDKKTLDERKKKALEDELRRGPQVTLVEVEKQK